MIKNLLILLRNILHFPFKILIFLAKIYSKILSFIDPNGSERQWEELSQKEIDKKINSNLKLKLNNYKTTLFNSEKKLKFYTPTKMASYRAHTIFSKEKDTIKWIETYGKTNRIFFDIGANMGVYSLFYAATHKSKVYSFEPSFRNLDLLSRNISLNNLNDYIYIISSPVFDKSMFNDFSKSTNTAAMAEATFGKNTKYINTYKTLSVSLDGLVDNNLIERPNLIKIDVDGNEKEVIEGAKKIIKSDNCISILIETRDATSKFITKILSDSGFEKDLNFDHKDPDKISDWNEIWVKNK